MQISMKYFKTKIVFNKNPVENTGQCLHFKVYATRLIRSNYLFNEITQENKNKNNNNNNNKKKNKQTKTKIKIIE